MHDDDVLLLEIRFECLVRTAEASPGKHILRKVHRSRSRAASVNRTQIGKFVILHMRNERETLKVWNKIV